MSTQRRRVLENSGLKDGVYIEGMDGKVYTVDDWQGDSDRVNSIIVASGDIKFRMAKYGVIKMPMSSRSSAPIEKFITAISGETAAKADYDGAGNTIKIEPVGVSESYAPGYCINYVFYGSRTHGYLPSLGQLYVAYQNKDAINAALAACGGDAMKTDKPYWSSTFYGLRGTERHCWTLNWDNGSVGSNNLAYKNNLRVFGDIS